MNRAIPILLAVLLLLGLAACGGAEHEPPVLTEEEKAAQAAEAAEAARQAALSRVVPYHELLPKDPRTSQPVRIGVLGSPNRPQAGRRIALLLGGLQKKNLEWKLGRPVEVSFVSRSERRHKPGTQIRYRPNFLEAALEVARAIAGTQNVQPMSDAELEYEETDVFVYMGASAR